MRMRTLFGHYFVTALRNLATHKLYSFINIAGLSVGLACAIFIVLFVRHELSAAIQRHFFERHLRWPVRV